MVTWFSFSDSCSAQTTRFCSKCPSSLGHLRDVMVISSFVSLADARMGSGDVEFGGASSWFSSSFLNGDGICTASSLHSEWWTTEKFLAGEASEGNMDFGCSAGIFFTLESLGEAVSFCESSRLKPELKNWRKYCYMGNSPHYLIDKKSRLYQ